MLLVARQTAGPGIPEQDEPAQPFRHPRACRINPPAEALLISGLMMADKGSLLENVAATGSYNARARGTYTFAVAGTFGGATVSLDMLGPDGVTAITITGTGLTAAGAVNVDLPSGRYRASVAGGAPAGLYASLKQAGA